MKIKKLNDFNFKGKIAIIRVDFNVPLDESGQITDDTRIKAAIPTISYLIDNSAKIILAAHFGRPKGKVIKELSMEPICKYLKNKLGQNIHLIKTNINNTFVP